MVGVGGLRMSDRGAVESSVPPSQFCSENKPSLNKARGHTHTHEELKGDHTLEEY